MRRSQTEATAQVCRALLTDDSGQNLVEYGLVVGLIGLAPIASTTSMATQLKAAFSSMGSALAQAAGVPLRLPA